MMNPIYLKERFQIRGVKINSSASKYCAQKMASEITKKIDNRFFDLYFAFNGFSDDDFDLSSFVSIWPLEKIINNIDYDRLPYVPFADLAFNAEIYEFDVTNFDHPVVARFSGENIANSVNDFWDYLLSPSSNF